MISIRKTLPLKFVRSGLYAWSLVCKEIGCSNLPLDEKLLNRVLMLINLTMSENVIKQWIKKVRTHPSQLECDQPDRLTFETTVRDIQTKHARLSRKDVSKPNE